MFLYVKHWNRIGYKAKKKISGMLSILRIISTNVNISQKMTGTVSHHKREEGIYDQNLILKSKRFILHHSQSSCTYIQKNLKKNHMMDTQITYSARDLVAGKKKPVSCRKAMTLNTASEIFDLYFPQKLTISDRQGSEPTAGL